MKKTARKKFIEWTITAGLVVLLAVVIGLRFLPGRRRPGTHPREPQWRELSAVATVEVARDEETIGRGLMGRESLPRNSGMYFLFETNEERRFWMYNTRISLSIAFMRADGTIATIKSMEPFDETRVSSDEPVKDALEMNQGWFAANGIKVGDRATLDGNKVYFSRRVR